MDTPQNVAFDQRAPQDERRDALGELQKAYAPRALSDLIPSEDVQRVIDWIQDRYAEAELAKADVAVPFPSRSARAGEPGMQSVRIDDWQITLQGDYWERPAALSFDALRTMVEQTPVLSAVVMTRVRQILRFARVAEGSTNEPGFEVRHIDRMHQLTDAEQESIRLLHRFFMNCGWEWLPRRRKALRRDSFAQFLAKVARDSLVLDSVGIELEWKRDKRFGIDGFYAVDGATIRLCSEDGYQGDDSIFALQVVNGRICTAYTFEDLIYEPRNPRSDVVTCGYGLSETELLIKVVTGFLNAMTFNIRGFDSNSLPRGIIHLSGNYSGADLDAFRRYWNSMVRGINNAWSLPILVSKDGQSRAQFERVEGEFSEMYFAKWMTFLTSIICAIYGMSPSEINFDSFTGGNTSALSGSDTAEKLAASKDSGLRPLLAYFENLFTDYIAQEFSDKYVFRWTGMDPVDEQRMLEVRRSILTLNEMRAEEGYQAIEGPLGDAPMNPSLMGAWMQLQQAQAAGPGGAMPGAEGAPSDGDEGATMPAPDAGEGGEGGESVESGEGAQGEAQAALPSSADAGPPDDARELDDEAVRALMEKHGGVPVVKSFPVYVVG